MIITKPGKYRLNQDFSSMGAGSITHIPKGSIIEITQIDIEGRKVIGPELLDWEYYNIPCEPINE